MGLTPKEWLELSRSLYPTKRNTFSPAYLIQEEPIVDLVKEAALLSKGF
jgi:hypothetical protein